MFLHWNKSSVFFIFEYNEFLKRCIKGENGYTYTVLESFKWYFGTHKTARIFSILTKYSLLQIFL